MCEKLYNTDGHLQTFEAVVLSCKAADDRFAIVLDKTAFFPEGGGQAADSGTLNSAFVSDVKEINGTIFHYVDSPLDTGTVVIGKINWDKRFRRMQNHSGEHIVSGLIYRMFGYNNVGFHIGSEDVTIDFSGQLTREELNAVEYLANEAVFKNVKVTVEFPDAEKLKTLEYRSKLNLTENVRIVTVQGYDVCACCAPHVSYTGEIGIIKILDFIHYKGGVRVHMLCGFDALEDYRNKLENINTISVALSVKQPDALAAVVRMQNELAQQKSVINELKKEWMQLKVNALSPTDGNMCLFEQNADAAQLRYLVNETVKLCGEICAAFSGSDETGYLYVMGSRRVNLKDKVKEINQALNGRGGGSADMIQGNVIKSRNEIESYFDIKKI